MKAVGSFLASFFLAAIGGLYLAEFIFRVTFGERKSDWDTAPVYFAIFGFPALLLAHGICFGVCSTESFKSTRLSLSSVIGAIGYAVAMWGIAALCGYKP